MEVHLRWLTQNSSILKFKQYGLSQKAIRRKFLQYQKRQIKNILAKTKFLLQSSLIIIHQKTNTTIANILMVKATNSTNIQMVARNTNSTTIHKLTTKNKAMIKSMTMVNMATHTELNYCQKTVKSVRHQQYSSLLPLAHILSLRVSPWAFKKNSEKPGS